MKNFTLLLSFLIIITISFGCNATKATIEASGDIPEHSNVIENPDVNFTLTDHLRRVTSIRVSGNGPDARVSVRGTCPIYVLDGQRLRGGLSEFYTMIPIQDIKSIRVLTNEFRVYRNLNDGQRGIIEIETK